MGKYNDQLREYLSEVISLHGQGLGSLKISNIVPLPRATIREDDPVRVILNKHLDSIDRDAEKELKDRFLRAVQADSGEDTTT